MRAMLRHLLWAALAMILGASPPRPAAADEFASQGQACGSPGHPMDMSRIYAAVEQYPNGELLFLTPTQEARLREQFRQANAAGRSPMRELAPCFGCNQQVSACIAYDGPRQGARLPPEQFGSNGGGQPPAQFGSNGGGQPPAQFGSNGGGQPPPGRGDSEACRKNPQSYSCLYGHGDVIAANPPACRKAACDDRALPAQGWHIQRRLGGKDCLWAQAQGQDAAGRPYDPAAIDRQWEKQWYPQWRGRVDRVFQSRVPLMRHLTAKGVTGDWWFEVRIAPDGRIIAVKNRESTYQPRGGPNYKQWQFEEDTRHWQDQMLKMKAPPFPAGSLNEEVTMSVNFNNRQTGVRNTPDVPREPALQKEHHGEAKRLNGC